MAEGDFIFGRSGDYVVVSKPKGIVFVEARFKDNHTHTDKGCQQVMALLERELSPDRLDGNTIITLESDLLGTVLYEGVPRDMFHSLRVVEFQGLDPSTIVVPARDVAIKINFYGLSNETPITSDNEERTMLPHAMLDGLWELDYRTCWFFALLSQASRSNLARFLEQCALVVQLPTPTVAHRFSLLRRQFQEFVWLNIITGYDNDLSELPCYAVAKLQYSVRIVAPGSLILALANHIPDDRPFRFVDQMVYRSLPSFLEPSSGSGCSIEVAVDITAKYLNHVLVSGGKDKTPH
ncbi:hypothetical protein CTRI78_v005659 [Colletotrichum trifolii]|uniref:Uncharacterized protein n=1 Tax=Colletotrichum trifolii TaxID=5466 RepID=A0A4V6QEX4_COLTR|nr:hypothetical protein CTRI78_v005659 [Colletotrichum trifolii]